MTVIRPHPEARTPIFIEVDFQQCLYLAVYPLTQYNKQRLSLMSSSYPNVLGTLCTHNIINILQYTTQTVEMFVRR